VSARPRISVITPTHNRRQVLPRTIASVLAQDEPNFELIIVDDGSTDDTARYLATLTDPRIRVIAAACNVGAAAARNLGLDAARADIVALLDDDDVYLPRRLSAALAVFESNPDVVCTLSSSIKRDLARTQVMALPDLKLAPAAFEWALICDLIGVEGSSITMRRAAARQIGGFSAGLKLTEDREFLIRLARLGAGGLIADTLWQKHWSDDGLSNQWDEAGPGLLRYVAARPEFVNRYRKLGSYLATKVLVADLRHRSYATLWRDLRAFRRAGLIDGNLGRMWRDHREVRRYRRKMKSDQALASLTGAPDSWM
jgi:glycosyltransferase involved in cell wall biosynthesis